MSNAHYMTALPAERYGLCDLGVVEEGRAADLVVFDPLTVAESAYVSSMRHAWIIVFAYSLQIFFDFSAYSDIAIGLGRMLGITLPEKGVRDPGGPESGS